MKYFIATLAFLFITFVSVPAFSKRVPGPGKKDFTLDAGKSKDITFELDTTTTHIVGMGIGSYVDYYLYDPEKHLVDWDITPGTTCFIRYSALQAGTHILKIKNYGSENSNVSIRID